LDFSFLNKYLLIVETVFSLNCCGENKKNLIGEEKLKNLREVVRRRRLEFRYSIIIFIYISKTEAILLVVLE